MAKQLSDIVTTFSELPDSEKVKIVKNIRHNKYVLRPALKKRQAKKKTAKKKTEDKKLIKLLQGLSPEELQKVLGEQNAE